MKSKILFIDDEQEVLNVYENIFKTESREEVAAIDDFLGGIEESTAKNKSDDYEILTATSGEEGVEAFKKNEGIKLAFIDMRMPPGINGAETAKRIRALDERVEIVIATAYSDINLNEIVETIGSPDKLIYLKKPFAKEEIEQLALNLTTKYDSERIREKFLSNISHELKTPLSVILGFSQLLQDITTDPEAKEYNDMVYKNAQHLEYVISQMLHLDETVCCPMNYRKADINIEVFFETLKRNISLYESTYPEVNFSTNIENVTENIHIDSNKMGIAITNIVHNSFKFTKKGIVDLKVVVEEENVVFIVTDSGIGIAEEAKSQVFEKFYRHENDVHTEIGLGVGLSVARSTVEAHGGNIQFLSKEGKGSQFKVIFPKHGGEA